MITKLIILYLLIMFFSFRIPSQKSKRGLKRKKLQERTPVVFHLHNLLDTVKQVFLSSAIELPQLLAVYISFLFVSILSSSNEKKIRIRWLTLTFQKKLIL